MASAAATITLRQLDTLVRLVVRAFYEPGHIIVADALVREKKYMKDEDLAAKLKLHYKQIRKYLTDLKRDRLVKSEVRSEANTAPPEGQQYPQYRKTTFEFFYIDYKEFVDTLKWKINAMNKMLDKEQRPGYQCPRCKMAFSDLQMNELINFQTGKAECSRCKTEIEMVAPADGGGSGVISQAAFNKQLKVVKEKLREIEDVEIPYIDRGTISLTAELTKQMARKAGNQSTGGSGAGQAAAAGKRGRDYDFGTSLEVEIITANPTDALSAGQPKVEKEAIAAGKGVVPWMAGAQKAAALAAEKKQEKAAVAQAQAAAKPQQQEWNQRFFQELNRQASAAAAATAANDAAAESMPDVAIGEAPAEEEGEAEEEEQMEVGEKADLVALSEVTQEHIEKMTPPQYEKYAAAYKKRIEEYNASVMQK